MNIILIKYLINSSNCLLNALYSILPKVILLPLIYSNNEDMCCLPLNSVQFNLERIDYHNNWPNRTGHSIQILQTQLENHPPLFYHSPCFKYLYFNLIVLHKMSGHIFMWCFQNIVLNPIIIPINILRDFLNFYSFLDNW